MAWLVSVGVQVNKFLSFVEKRHFNFDNISLRSSIMLWFLWELRNTMKYEHSTKKLDFLLHFGASSLVWFIYLPIVAVVALQVSPMWRYKLLLGSIHFIDDSGTSGLKIFSIFNFSFRNNQLS